MCVIELYMFVRVFLEELCCQALTSDKTVAKSESTPDKEIVTRCAIACFSMVKVVLYTISNIDSQQPVSQMCHKGVVTWES